VNPLVCPICDREVDEPSKYNVTELRLYETYIILRVYCRNCLFYGVDEIFVPGWKFKVEKDYGYYMTINGKQRYFIDDMDGELHYKVSKIRSATSIKELPEYLCSADALLRNEAKKQYDILKGE